MLTRLLPTTFETPRLLARLPVPADSARIFASYASKPEVSRYMVWRPHVELATSEAFVADCIAAAGAGTRWPYVLCERSAPDVVIGMLEARPVAHKIDLGYVLAPSAWGRGYMPEAISVFSARALEVREVFRVQAFCDVENIASQRALEKAGFLREGRHERFFVHPNVAAEPRPCYMYAKCK
jgi:ribosomal-protein-alanine N-acetyltransferase